MFKWFAILGVVTALGGSGYWVITEILEKGRLESELKTSEQTVSLLSVAMQKKDASEVELYNKILELEDNAIKYKKKFNLSAMQKISKSDPVRAARLFSTNTDLLYSQFEQKTRGFNNRHRRKTKMLSD